MRSSRSQTARRYPDAAFSNNPHSRPAQLAVPAPFVARAATALKPVTFTLDWLYQGASAGFLVAQEKGFYRDAGLDVTILAGKGSGTTAQLVASKATPIGFSDGFVVANSVAKGMAIKTVGTIYRRDPAAIMVLDESPIKSPKDLEGKSVAMTAGSAQFQQWPAYVKGAGIDPNKIKIVNIDPAGVGAALVNGRVDAIGGYVFSYAPSIEVRAKKKLRTFWFADSGVTIVSNGIIVHQDLLKSDPDLVRAFVAPSIKGFLYGRQHVDEAIATVKKYQPTADDGVTQARMRAVLGDVADAQHQGQAARLGLRCRLGRHHLRAQTVCRRFGAADDGPALHQRVRPDRHRLRAAARLSMSFRGQAKRGARNP